MTGHTEGASMCGKIPIRLDFVSLQCQYDEAIALDEWLGQEVARAHQTGAPLPANRARFLLSLPGRAMSLIGVLEPSRDQAGRAFPAAVFAPLPLSRAAGSLGAIPLFAKPFWESAERLFDEVGGLSYDALKDRLRTLSLPEEASFDASQGDLARLLADAASSFVGRVFEPPVQDVVVAAGSLIRGARTESPQEAPIFRCRAPDEPSAALWCEWARRALGTSPPTPCLWWQRAAEPSLWISLSRPPHGQLSLLSAEASVGASVVTLSSTETGTDAPAPPRMREVLERGTVDELFACFAPPG